MLEKVPTQDEVMECINANPEFIVSPVEVIGFWSLRDWTMADGRPLKSLKSAIWCVNQQKLGISKTRERNGVKAYEYRG